MSCDIDGCEKPTRRKKALWCAMHYHRWYRYGDPFYRTRRTADPIALPPPRVCSICGTGPVRGHGWCRLHYERWYRTGDPLLTRAPSYGTTRTITPDYRRAHRHLIKDRGQAATHSCAHCGRTAAEWAYNHTDPHPLTSSEGMSYSLDQSRYLPLCRSCHKALDRSHR